MQEAALRAAGLADWRYLRLPLPPETFAETVRALPAAGFRGVNVTIPHKEAALALAGAASGAAQAIGAANTLTFEPDGTIAADNTDAPGLLEAIARAGGDPAAGRALVLGAGGSARAVVYALLGAGAPEVLVWNRTHSRAQALAAELGARAVTRPEPAPLLVNCTSVGLDGAQDPFKALPIAADGLRAGSVLVDLVYRDGGTPLLRAARARGLVAVDGLEVLVAQGAASFERWTGMAADRRAMREAVGIPGVDG